MDDNLVVKTDSNGVFEWGQQYGSSWHDRTRSIKATSDGSYITAGSVGNSFMGSPADQGHNMSAIKLSNSGDIIWSTIISSKTNHSDY
ncbi:MAG: hypothetical protein ACRCTA_03900, partial [Bacilli bacterium]